MKASWLTIGALLAAASPVTQGLPPGPIGFASTGLEVGGKITEVLPRDLDGDGRLDLLVVRGREALVYFQEEGGAWPPAPNQRFRFHPRTVLFDVGDLDGDGAAELVLLRPDDVAVYELRKRRNGRMLYSLRPRTVAAVESFLSRPVPDEVRRKEILRDLDQDGLPDLLVPRRDGFHVLRNLGAEGFAAPETLAAPPKAILHPGRPQLSSQLFAQYWFANPNLLQFDGEGSLELVLAREGQLSVFGAPTPGALPLSAQGTYTVPDQKRFSFNVENPFELDFTMPLRLLDVNGDGRLDVASTHVGQGTTRLFLNQGDPQQAFSTPALTLRAKGVTLIAFFRDLDGDGRPDLILPRLDKIGMWSIVKAFLSRSVPIEVLFFYQRAEGDPFPAEPDLVRELEIPISINSQSEGMRLGSTVIASLGDFDGDGQQDVLIRTESDALEILRGHDRTFSESADHVQPIPDVDAYRFCVSEVLDLDGDGRDDVLLRYLSWDREQDRITLLMAR
ncbi:MAG: VCBS repeat-containing protein [Planctomycetes bacterium]|nr:VCBS repeat-containing protein [Planctomycetota bacterium]